MTNPVQALIDSVSNFDARVRAKLELKLDKDGIAVKAKALETARSFYISGDGTATASFDGSASVTLNLSLKNSGVTAGQYGTPNLVPVVTVNSKGIITSLSTLPMRRSVEPYASLLDLPSSGETDTIYLIRDNGATLMYRWNGVSYENMTANMAIASVAQKLAVPRLITLGGDLDGSFEFDGSGDVTVTTLLNNSGVTAGTWPKVTVDAKGRVIGGSALSPSDVPVLNQDTTGRSAVAGLLETPRTISLSGDATGSVSFDGSADVGLFLTIADNSHLHTIANITGLSGALSALAPLVSPTFTGTPFAPTAVIGTNTTQIATTAFARAEIGSLAPTKAGVGATGVWAIGVSGNAATASKLSASRTLSLSGDATGGAVFDGSTDVTTVLTLANTAVVAGAYGNNASTLLVSADSKGRVTNLEAVALRQATTVLPGIVQLSDVLDSTSLTTAATSNAVRRAYDIGAAAIPASLKGAINGVAELDGSGLVKASQLPSYVDDVLEHVNQAGFPTIGEQGKIYIALDSGRIYRWTGSQYMEISAVVGNSDSATKLANARTIAIAGDGTGSVLFDGSVNVSISMALANTGVAAAAYNASPVGHTPFTVDSKGRITATGADVLITPAWNSITSRPTTIAGFGITDALALTSSTATALGSASAGIANTAARADHVHPVQTNVAGNAGTATKLAAAVTINGTSFDGSASITVTDSTKEPVILSGAAGSFWNGGKVWTDFATSARNTALLGLVTVNTTPIVAGDTVLAALGKLQGQATLAATQASPTLTGIPTAPTASVNTNTVQIATTEFVITQIADDAPTKSGGGAVGDWGINVTGSAAKLTTPRSLSVTGDATGTTNFDGSANVSTELTLAITGVTAGTYGSATQSNPLTVDSKGRVTAVGAPVTITPAWESVTGKPTTTATSGLADAESITRKGVANGYAGLDANGKVPSIQLPSYVDDVVEGANLAAFPETGETGKIYVAIDTNKPYRWSGSVYVEISASPGSTDAVVEGTTNLYFTEERAQAAVSLISGNAGSATKLQTARDISLTGDAIGTVSFDGSANVAMGVSLSISGVDAGTYGGSATTQTPITVDAKGRVTAVGAEVLITPSYASLTDKPTTMAGYGITDALALSGVVAMAPGTAAIGIAMTAARADHVHPLQVNVTGNAGTATLADAATKLASPRAIGVTGDASGVVAFDGTAAVNIPLVLANSGVAAGEYPHVTVDAKGRVISGRALLAADIPTLNQSTTGNAATATAAITATKLATSPSITISGDGTAITNFDGSANVVLHFQLGNSGVAPGTYNNSAQYISPLTVDAKGRVMGVGAAIKIAPSWADIMDRPTTMGDLGLVDGTALLQYTTVGDFPAMGYTGQIYLDISENVTYRWTGSGYESIGSNIANTDNLIEGLTNLYFTDARAQTAVNNIVGNAGTATKLLTVRSIALVGDGTASVNFDGSDNVSGVFTLANSGVVAGTYGNATEMRPLTVDAKGRVTAAGVAITITPAWDSVTGKPTTVATSGLTDAQSTSQKGIANGYASLDATGKVPTAQLPSYVDDVLEFANLAGFPVAGESGKIYVATNTNKPYRWSGSVYVEIAASPGSTDSVTEGATNLYFTAARAQVAVTTITGNAATAAKLLVSRLVGNTGDVSSLGSFDGSNNLTLVTTLAASGVVAGTYNDSATAVRPFTVDAKGRVTSIGAAVNIAVPFASLTAKPTTLAGYGITDGSALTSALPAAIGTAAVGVATTAARADHVHQAQTAVSGNAGTATALQTARLINGVSFNGSADISVPPIGANYQSTTRVTLLNGGSAQSISVANLLCSDTYTDSSNVPVNGIWAKGAITTAGQFNGSGAGLTALNAASLSTGVLPAARLSGTYALDVTGNATTATRLQTIRTINGVNFDGSANITIADATKEPAIAAGVISQFWSGAKTWVDVFTQVRSATLNGLSLASSAAVLSTDTMLVGVGKLQAQVDLRAPLASPSFTGIPLVPTAAVNTNTTQAASTAFVRTEIGSLAPTKTGGGASGSWGIGITGNAATATALETARTINGVSFNGSANITIADATKMPVAGGSFTGFVGTAAINGVMATNDGSSSLEVRNVSAATGDSGLAMMAFHAQGTYAIKMGLRADGYFGLGGWSRGAWSWYSDPSGNMVAAGNVSAYSDPRLKENFKRVEKPLEIIGKLDGGTFNWKQGFTHTQCKAGKHDYGILADQVEAVMPEIVTQSIEIDGASYRTVDYSKIVPVLIEGTKELHAMILELKAEIAELRRNV